MSNVTVSGSSTATLSVSLTGIVSTGNNHKPGSGLSAVTSVSYGNVISQYVISVPDTTMTDLWIIDDEYIDLVVIVPDEDISIMYHTSQGVGGPDTSCIRALADFPLFISNPNVATYESGNGASADTAASATTPITRIRAYHSFGSAVKVTVYLLGSDY